MTEFADKTALVVGAASGIGAAVARRLHQLGASVYCADVNASGASSVASSLPGASAFALDVCDEAAWLSATDGVVASRGRLDILVSCVGISAASPIDQTPLEEWRRVLATNLDGAFLATKHGIRVMRAKGGAILLIGSASGIRPAAGAAAYSTSKAGMRMLARVAAKECRDAGLPVRINLVSPAGVKTGMWNTMPFFQELVRTAGSEDAAYAAMSKSGGGHFMEADEVAHLVCFLVSDAARHITGADIPIDDGYVL